MSANRRSSTVWWERGALTAWQAAPQTLRTADQYGLRETRAFQPFASFESLSGTPDDEVEQLAQSLSPMIAIGVLGEINSYTWRGADAMLSTAQDYRPGMRGDQ